MRLERSREGRLIHSSGSLHSLVVQFIYSLMLALYFGDCMGFRSNGSFFFEKWVEQSHGTRIPHHATLLIINSQCSAKKLFLQRQSLGFVLNCCFFSGLSTLILLWESCLLVMLVFFFHVQKHIWSSIFHHCGVWYTCVFSGKQSAARVTVNSSFLMLCRPRRACSVE